MTQSELDFDSAHARHDDPGTAKSAAAAVNGARANALESAVLSVLREHGSLTSWQIAQRGDLEYGSTSPRLKHLEKKNLVRRAGKVAVEGRRPSILWEAIDGGQ